MDEFFQMFISSVGLLALLKIAHNTGRIAEKIDTQEKTLLDHEKRIRKIESI